VRAKLNQEHVAQLTEHQQALHERFMDWRNKHIAHSVNPFEENQFVVQYVAETVHEIGIQAVSVRQDRLVGLSAEDLSDIQDLIQALLAIVDAEYETERARLLALVRRIPVAEVIAGAKGRSAPAGIESVKRVRSR
jgi:hypothetical protein